MLLLPWLMPDTTPADDIVAIAVLLLLHVPPGMLPVSVVVAPATNSELPEIDTVIGLIVVT